MQPTTDPYEKIPYWMRPDYKAPGVTCTDLPSSLCSSDSSQIDTSNIVASNKLGGVE